MPRRTFIDDLVADELRAFALEGITPESSADYLAAAAQEGPRQCRRCGCTDDRACSGGCYWVSADLCSRCAK
jgi:hypothetical protein